MVKDVNEILDFAHRPRLKTGRYQCTVVFYLLTVRAGKC